MTSTRLPPSAPSTIARLLVVALVVASVTLCSGVAVAHGAGGDHGSDGSHHGENSSSANASHDICSMENPQMRAAQVVAGVKIQESRVCRPDRPSVVAASVAGTNNVPMDVLMKSGLARDAVVKSRDRDRDGDPDVVNITLEIAGINEYAAQTDEIAPGVSPAFWTFAPKTRGMVSEGSKAERLIRMPSPPIRVEQGDEVHVTVENTHYFPHTIHFHGVDHSYAVEGEGNDGVPTVSEKPIMPGESRTYDFQPRTAGTMFYHCHVVPNVHVTMGLNGMFVVAENESNNRVQTFNVGAGKVRHPSKGTLENYTAAYDLQYQGVDKELHRLPKQYDDPRRLAKAINREYDATERDPDYFLLNGKSYPYTIRESLVVVQPNERYRLRVSNGGSETVSLHTHGHKFAIEAYDGVSVPDGQAVRRDVVTVSAAQRVDLALNTTNDGLHSYGPGVWFMHDHREEAVTTDGISPGGTASMIVYQRYMDEGVPRTKGDLSRLFDPAYYDGNVSYWGHLDSEHLGEPPATETPTANGTNATATGSGSGAGAMPNLVGSLVLLLAGAVIGVVVLRGPRELAVVVVAGLAILALLAVAPGGVTAHGTENETVTSTPGTAGHGDGHGGGHAEMGGMMDMEMVANGTVVNGDPSTPPGNCTEIRGEQSVTIRAGSKYAPPGQIFSYDDENFTWAPCTRVSVTLVNEDEVRHQWMVHGLPTDAYPMGMFNIEVQGGGRVTATFVTPASGTYSLHCSLPQHEQKGMHGTITIENADGGTATPTGGGGPGFGPAGGLVGLLAAGGLLRLRVH